MFLLRKKPKLSSTKNTHVRAALPSFARVKHLVDVNNKKVGSMRNIQDILLKPHTDKFGNRDLFREVVRSRTSSPDKG
ncbi:unnamed protein product [Prunus armeniaca]